MTSKLRVKTLYYAMYSGFARGELRRNNMRQARWIDYYAVLNIGPAATQREISRAYRRLALAHHPDRAGAGGVERFLLLNEARDTLTDAAKKAEYDRARNGEMERREFLDRARQGRVSHDLSFVRTFIKKTAPDRGPLLKNHHRIIVSGGQCVMCQGRGAREDRNGAAATCPWCGGSGRWGNR